MNYFHNFQDIFKRLREEENTTFHSCHITHCVRFFCTCFFGPNIAFGYIEWENADKQLELDKKKYPTQERQRETRLHGKNDTTLKQLIITKQCK